MSSRPSIPLTEVLVTPGDCDYQSLLSWPFAEKPFYERQIKYLLEKNIEMPLSARESRILVATFQSAKANRLGCRILVEEHRALTVLSPLGDVPVLAVHPSYRGQGHGRSIVEQIFASAVIAYHWAKAGDEDSDHLFLDVYAANEPAISLYRKCGFEVLNPDARIPDPEENNETYLVMAKRISIAPE